MSSFFSGMEFLRLCSLLLLCAFQLGSAQTTTTDPNEVAALSKIVDHWNLRKYINLSTDPCLKNAHWTLVDSNPRVTCDCVGSNCHVTHLKIYALDISGEMPKELFELKRLMDLNLGQNVLSGVIPAEIGQLSDMQYLSLGINNLTGQVPPELGNLTKLISLSFSSNSFVGQLPKELGKLNSLQQLYIDSSGVSGPLPLELANLKSLQVIWASDNLFRGKLPGFLGNFTELRDLRIEGTSLEGPIPSSFGALTKLETLKIGDLSIEDSSLNFLENQTSLSILTLRNCRLSGEIPEVVGRFPKLIHLDLSFNKLTGPVPISFQNLTLLKNLYLGNNNLSGQLPKDIITTELITLDVSFNGISGDVPPNYTKSGFSMNVIGTSVNANSLLNRKSSEFQICLKGETKCSSNQLPLTSFAVKSGGTELTSSSGIKYEDDSEILGPASLYTSSKSNWAVSNTGNFLFNPSGPQYIAKTDSQITQTLDSELYKTARISPNSLRYFGFDLANGKYTVDLHFAEIAMDDDAQSWKGLGRRIFDIYIQGEKVVQDFNIKEEAGGWKRGLVKRFEANVTNTVMDIQFLWAGKGTCCIPIQGTFGPLVSAIHVYQGSGGVDNFTNGNKKRVGKIVGIAIGCVGGLALVLSIMYLWWTKRGLGHTKVPTDSPTK